MDFLDNLEQLNEHLQELDPVLAKFAMEHNYEYLPLKARGLYPRVSLHREVVLLKEKTFCQNIHIDMDLDKNGDRYEKFFNTIPYGISAGSWIDDRSIFTRYHGPYAAFNSIPFCSLKESIDRLLQHYHAYLQTVSVELVYACNTTSTLSQYTGS